MTPDKERMLAKMIGRGYTRTEAALRLDVSTKTVTRTLKKAEVVALAQETMEAIDPDAADVLRELLSSEREEIRLRAAMALLRDPPPPPEDAPSNVPTITVVDRL